MTQGMTCFNEAGRGQNLQEGESWLQRGHKWASQREQALSAWYRLPYLSVMYWKNFLASSSPVRSQTSSTFSGRLIGFTAE